ncbi:MAG: hypothetical protein F4Y14_07385 [Acidobacteria bacterium]|nr:hypothetical protein [Acidobacteriota bacterium]
MRARRRWRESGGGWRPPARGPSRPRHRYGSPRNPPRARRGPARRAGARMRPRARIPGGRRRAARRRSGAARRAADAFATGGWCGGRTGNARRAGSGDW